MQAEKAAWGEPEEGAIWGDLGRPGATWHGIFRGLWGCVSTLIIDSFGRSLGPSVTSSQGLTWGIVICRPGKDFDRNFLPRHTNADYASLLCAETTESFLTYSPIHLLCLAQGMCSGQWRGGRDRFDPTGGVFFVLTWYRGTLCRVSFFLNSHLAFSF